MNERAVYAYSESLAFECAQCLPRDPKTGDYVVPDDILEYYAKLIAYKVAYNLKLGYKMNPDNDPLNYVNCEDYPCL